MTRKLLAGALFLFIPAAASAAVSITEIMYDLEGGDSGREWVEIYNSGSDVVDLADWRFFEAGVNHTFQNEGDMTLEAGGYAVIADDPAAFSSDWPSVSVLILDSSFSLKNTGEYVAIKNPNGDEVDGFTYSSQEGADGTGKSLQLVNGSWIAADPSPGAENEGSSTSNSETEQDSGSDASGGGVVDSTKPIAESPQIYADGGDDRRVVAGADIVFEGKAYGSSGELLDAEHARFVWNFGDGEIAEGRSRIHYFRYPGTYIVALSVSSGENTATDYTRVEAEPSQISIVGIGTGSAGPYITLKNDSSRDIHLSGWKIRTESGEFAFPEASFIAAGTELRMPKEITGLAPTEPILLLYPNNNLAFAWAGSETNQSAVELGANGACGGRPCLAVPRSRLRGTGEEPGGGGRENARPYEASEDVPGGEMQTQRSKDATLHDNLPTTTQPALVVSAPSTLLVAGNGTGDMNGTPLSTWLLALGALTLLVVGGVVFITIVERKKQRGPAEEYDIVEDDQ